MKWHAVQGNRNHWNENLWDKETMNVDTSFLCNLCSSLMYNENQFQTFIICIYTYVWYSWILEWDGDLSSRIFVKNIFKDHFSYLLSYVSD